MVGYSKHDTMTQQQKLIAGCISGMLTRFITQPMDVIKIRTQLAKRKNVKDPTKFGMVRTTTRILKEEGLTAFWTGHSLGQIHSVIAVSAQFYAYEQATKFIATSDFDPKYMPYLFFMCGIYAGCVSTTLVIPIEVIRVRQMLIQDQYKGMINGARRVYKTGGILAFYEGLSASLCQMGPQVGISFSVFRFLQPRLLHYFSDCPGHCLDTSDGSHTVKPEAVFLSSSIAGSAAGFLSKSLTYPFDLAKRRLQILSHQTDDRFHVPSTSKHLIRCKTLSHCLIQTYKKEGLAGLFRGWKVTVYKAQMTSVAAFTTYELTCYFIRGLSN